MLPQPKVGRARLTLGLMLARNSGGNHRESAVLLRKIGGAARILNWGWRFCSFRAVKKHSGKSVPY